MKGTKDIASGGQRTLQWAEGVKRTQDIALGAEDTTVGEECEGNRGHCNGEAEETTVGVCEGCRGHCFEWAQDTAMVVQMTLQWGGCEVKRTEDTAMEGQRTLQWGGCDMKGTDNTSMGRQRTLLYDGQRNYCERDDVKGSGRHYWEWGHYAVFLLGT